MTANGGQVLLMIHCDTPLLMVNQTWLSLLMDNQNC